MSPYLYVISELFNSDGTSAVGILERLRMPLYLNIM